MADRARSTRTGWSSTSSPTRGIELQVKAKRPGPTVRARDREARTSATRTSATRRRGDRLRAAPLRLHGRATPRSSTGRTWSRRPGASRRRSWTRGASLPAARLPELSGRLVGTRRPRTSSSGRTGGTGTRRSDAEPSTGRPRPGDPVILAGDVGGTNTRLAWFDVTRRRCWFPGPRGPIPASSTRASTPILTAFLRERAGKPEHVCVGVAGPVRDGRVDAVNLAWDVDGPALAGASRSARRAARQRPRGERVGPRRAARRRTSRCSSRAGRVPTGQRGGGLRGNRPRRGGAGLGRPAPLARWRSEGATRTGRPRDELQSGAVAVPHGRGRPRQRGAGALGPRASATSIGSSGTRRAWPSLPGSQKPSGVDDPAPVIAKAGLGGAGRDLRAGPRAVRRNLWSGGRQPGPADAGDRRGVPRRRHRAAPAPRAPQPRRSWSAFAAKGRVRALLELIPVRVVLNDRAALLVGAARRAALEAGLLE